MITLHHCIDARSFRPLWALEEIGLPYRLEMLPFPPRALAPAFKEVNPLGTIPAFADGAVRMTESAAICQYLADRHGPALRVEPADPAYGGWLNALHFGEATLTFPQTLILRYARLEPEPRRVPQVVEDYRRWFLARVRDGLLPILEHADHVAAGRFTVADISVGYALLLAERIGLEPDLPDQVRAYWARLQQRDGYRRAQAAQLEAGAAQGAAASSV